MLSFSKKIVFESWQPLFKLAILFNYAKIYIVRIPSETMQ